jgi:HAD superfamily hydrolase (TIGR01509 family)
MTKALIFDFDGLILDTETPEFQSWVEIYESHGLSLPIAQWIDMVGRGTHEITWTPYDGLEEHLGPGWDRDRIRALRRARLDELIARETLRPGVDSLLREAETRGLKVGVASSSSHAWVDPFLKKFGIHNRFQVIKCRDDVPRAKPAPDLYLAAISDLGVHPKEAIALEDSANGIAAAKAAGLYCVAVPNSITRMMRLDQADVVVEALDRFSLSQFD